MDTEVNCKLTEVKKEFAHQYLGLGGLKQVWKQETSLAYSSTKLQSPD